ncbi:MAG: ABC-2 transporter permease [Oscillospiraceae bacterium]|nr:ABC-2 transporter permease [Oscillospiraceae bacterium]
MKGLLLKDLYMIRSYFKTYLFLIPVFWILSAISENSSFLMIYPCLLTAMIPVSLQTYDEKERWSCYSCTLPYNSRQIVSAKYLLNLFTILLNLAIILLGQLIRMLCVSGFNLQELLVLLFSGLFISVLPTMFTLPLIFKLGAEKAQLAYMLLAIIIGGAFAGIAMATEDKTETGMAILEVLQNPAVFIAIALAGIMILYGISWQISIKIYARKEFT